MVNGKKVHCESDRHGLKLPDKEQRGNVSALRRIMRICHVDIVAYPCPRSAKPAVILAHPRRQSLRPFFCRSKQDINRIARPASPVSRAGRYNTLHLASKVVCQRGGIGPLWKPPVLPVLALERISALHILQPYKTQRNGAGQRAGMKQADIKNLFSGCNHLIYGL